MQNKKVRYTPQLVMQEPTSFGERQHGTANFVSIQKGQIPHTRQGDIIRHHLVCFTAKMS